MAHLDDDSKKTGKIVGNFFKRSSRERENALDWTSQRKNHIRFEPILIFVRGTEMHYVGIQQLHSYFLNEASKKKTKYDDPRFL